MEFHNIDLVKSCLSNPVESLGYTKCYSSSSHKLIKKLSNSIRYNYQKICNWSATIRRSAFDQQLSEDLQLINNHQKVCNWSTIIRRSAIGQQLSEDLQLINNYQKICNWSTTIWRSVIDQNYQKICNWSRRPGTTLRIIKRLYFSRW